MRRFAFVSALVLALPASEAAAQDAGPGRQAFETRCARCHGGDANGGEMGPSIVFRLPGRTDAELSALIRDGLPGRGMPPNPIADPELSALVAYPSNHSTPD